MIGDFRDLVEHMGHEIEIVPYISGCTIVNIAIECMDCNMVLIDLEPDEEMIKRSQSDTG